MENDTNRDRTWMLRAISIARRGEGMVEPNPMVGCVLVKDNKAIGEGWHETFGQAHAEVNAIADARSNNHSTQGCTAYVSLEPCCHTGKTPPCVDALISAKVARVVIPLSDPNPSVAGKGIEKLRAAGIEVTESACQPEALALLAPFLKVTQKGKPWIIAKWAMTVDGKIATASGDSEWISNPSSREKVHLLRSRVDAIMVGSATARADNPKLTVRLAGMEHQKLASNRTPLRIVFDSKASVAVVSDLVQSAKDTPTLIAVGPQADQKQVQRFVDHGVEVWQSSELSRHRRLLALLIDLANRSITNILVEGGGGMLGLFHDLGEIDEVHAFVAPKLLGGFQARTPVTGLDRNHIADCSELDLVSAQRLDHDVYMILRRKC